METQSTNRGFAPVNELKHLTLSIEHGMSDAVRKKIVGITDLLLQKWKNDRILSTLIRMVRALTDYAASRKGDVSSDVIALIRSASGKIEYLCVPPGSDLPLSSKNSLLTEEIERYNILKQQIKSSTGETREPQAQPAAAGNEISLLKSIILSLDWEITDEIIMRLEKEITRLQKHWQNSKLHLSFLQMFKSIGSYVLSRGSDTHPDSITLLHSLYRSLEHIVMTPSLPAAAQKEILMREMNKFNNLKKTISATKKSQVKAEQPASISPMDDLIGTKVSNLSQVDDLIEEIHMLQESGGNDIPGTPQSSRSKPADSSVKEIIPNRLKKQPIPEIQKRLDAFFDDDEPMSELAFADSGDVVPYRDETSSPEVISGDSGEIVNYEDAEELIFEEDDTRLGRDEDLELQDYPDDDRKIESVDMEYGDDEISSEPASQLEADLTSSAVTETGLGGSEENEGVIPYDLEDDFFEEETAPSLETDTSDTKDKKYKIEGNRSEFVVAEEIEEDELDADENIQASSEDEIPFEDIDATDQVNEEKESAYALSSESVDKEHLENLKSAVAKHMLHGDTEVMDDVRESVELLGKMWPENTERTVMLKMIDSLAEQFRFDNPSEKEQRFELIFNITEHIEKNIESSGVPTGGADTAGTDASLTKIFSRYIEFQNSVIEKLTTSTLSSESEKEERGYHEKSGAEEVDTYIFREEMNEEISITDFHSADEGDTETLDDRAIIYDREIEKNGEPESEVREVKRGFWSKLMGLFR